MKSRMRRVICLVIVCCLVIGIAPTLGVTAQAATTAQSGYVGIYTAKDLDAIRNDLDGKYILMNDIDLGSWGDWTPIGEGSSSFSGVFDGNGYSIKNMSITDETVYENAGLFAVLESATVQNIRGISGTISCDDTPVLHAGAVAGQAYDSFIEQCASYLAISYENGKPDGSAYTSASGMRLCAGGIIGCAWGSTTINECMNANKITGMAAGTPLDVGGIAGWFSDESVIKNCFNIADLSVETGYVEAAVGGIVGNQFYATSCSIENCYNIGQLSCTCGKWNFDREYVGGIAGYLIGNAGSNTVSNCYYYSSAPAAVGSVRVWIAEGNKVRITVDADACSYNALQQKETYSGFDFSSVWKPGTSTFQFPTLRWRSDGNASCVHKYTSTGGNICTLCGYEFEPELIEYSKTLYAAIENAAVRNQPYAKAGSLVDKLVKGEAVRVTHWFYNSLGSKWYKTENGNYIYSERLISVSSGAKTYTLSFNANGGGVSNLPSSVKVREGVRYGIPGKVSGKPQRDGYYFIGYSTNKDATSAEYVPGMSVLLTSDLTLYAIWRSKDNLPAVTPQLRERINQVTGVPQGETNWCTSCATATMLRRYQVRCGLDATITLQTVRNKVESYKTPSLHYADTYTDNGSSFSTTYQSASTVRTNASKSGMSVKEYLISLLADHPEGICFYGKYDAGSGVHAIVLDYEGGHFYAYDPAMSNTQRLRLEDTFMFKNSKNSLDIMLSRMMYIWYMK